METRPSRSPRGRRGDRFARPAREFVPYSELIANEHAGSANGHAHAPVPVVPLERDPRAGEGFVDFDLPPSVMAGVRDVGYVEPTEVQREVIPILLEDRDVVAQSQTGSGKTAAFGLPLVASLDTDLPEVQAIVLVPTRELCQQVAGELTAFSRRRGLRVVAVFGGQSIRPQIEAIEQGAQIVVGTPGRVIDHLYRGTLRLNAVTQVVLDEADEMLDIGFAPQINEILSVCPRQRQTSLFSATVPAFVLELIDRFMVRPEFVSIRPQEITAREIDQLYYEVLEEDKVRALERLLRDGERFPKLLVFRNMQRGVDWLVKKMTDRGHAIAGLHGAMSQESRNRVMSAFRASKIRLLVATNVAARGIDVADIGLVMNYDIPQNPEGYVHRIGRTGRAGRVGTAVSLVGQWEMDDFAAIQSRLGGQIRREQLPFYGESAGPESDTHPHDPVADPTLETSDAFEPVDVAIPAPAVASRALPGERIAPRALPGEKLARRAPEPVAV